MSEVLSLDKPDKIHIGVNVLLKVSTFEHELGLKKFSAFQVFTWKTYMASLENEFDFSSF